MLGAFDYVRARSVAEACRLLGETDGASILAGGTDLLVEIRNGLRAPKLLLDIKSIDELARLQLDGPEVIIGAAVPLNVLAEHRAIRESLPALADAALSSEPTSSAIVLRSLGTSAPRRLPPTRRRSC